MKKPLPAIAILVMLSTFITGCGNSTTKEEATPLTIGGLGPGGGVIFAFLDDSNTIGLEVYSSAIGQSRWGCSGVSVDEDEARASNGVGVPAGVISSDILREASTSGICFPDAAELTFGFTNNDFNDWYLPSTDELITIREIGLLPGIPGDAYWSSTEDSDLNAFAVLIRVPENTLDDGEPSTSDKGSVINVIPIRTFLIE